MTYDDIITEVSIKLNLPKGLVDKAYRAYWKAVRAHITSLPLKANLTDDEFKELQPNVNIPSIGKLHVTFDRYKRMKKMNEIKNHLKQKKDVAYNKD